MDRAKAEKAIIREALFALQGVSGDCIKFYEESSSHEYGGRGRNATSTTLRITTMDGGPGSSASPTQVKVRVQIPNDVVAMTTPDRRMSCLGSGAKEVLYQCGEAGCMYQTVSRYIQEHDGGRRGATADAFCRGLEQRLNDDYEQAIVPLHELGTLREVLVAIRRPVERLKLLRRLVDTDLSGPNLLVYLLLRQRSAGAKDNIVIRDLIDQSSRPWFQLLFDWVFEGRIVDDTHHEIFARENAAATDLWNDRFIMEKGKLPIGVIDQKLADLAFYVGKAVIFIRSTLNDGTWSLFQHQFGVVPATAAVATGDGLTLRELGFCHDHTGDGNQLRRTLDQAAAIVNERILSALKQDYSLRQHLWALKQFLLLGQGDFFTAFIEGVQSEYPTTGKQHVFHRHDLVAILESSIQNTNAARLGKDILDRLQIELITADDNSRYMLGPKSLPEAPESNPLDRIVFEYHVPEPIRPIVNAEAKMLYQEIFTLFFKVRTVEFQLVLMWRQSTIIQRALNIHVQRLQDRDNVAIAQAFLRQVAYAQQSMMHFVSNLKSYLTFEVLECGWKSFEALLDQAVSFDAIIKAHHCYLLSIARKSFIQRDAELDISGKMSELLSTCETFCGYQGLVYSEALKEVDRAVEVRRKAEITARHGGWGFGSEREAEGDETCFGLSDPDLRNELDHMTTVFHKQMKSFLSLLRKKLHGQSVWEGMEDPPVNNVADTPIVNDLQVQRDGLEDQLDLDSIRFLACQLGSNNFYGFGTSF